MKYSNKFKARVALGAIREQKTLAELSREYEVSVNQISLWKQEAIWNMELSFGGTGSRKEKAYKDERIKKIQSKVGELTMERDFFAEACRSVSRIKKGGSLSRCRLSERRAELVRTMPSVRQFAERQRRA